MARNKKAAAKAADLWSKATLPTGGDMSYEQALRAVRDFCSENLPYGAKIVVTEPSPWNGLELRLTATVNYCLPCGTTLMDASVTSEMLDLGRLAEDGYLVGVVEAFSSTLARLNKEASAHYTACRTRGEA